MMLDNSLRVWGANDFYWAVEGERLWNRYDKKEIVNILRFAIDANNRMEVYCKGYAAYFLTSIYGKGLDNENVYDGVNKRYILRCSNFHPLAKPIMRRSGYYCFETEVFDMDMNKKTEVKWNPTVIVSNVINNIVTLEEYNSLLNDILFYENAIEDVVKLIHKYQQERKILQAEIAAKEQKEMLETRKNTLREILKTETDLKEIKLKKNILAEWFAFLERFGDRS